MRIFQALADAKGCAYENWYNPHRHQSFFPVWHHNNNVELKQPKEGEEMPILFNQESLDWAKWHVADTVVDVDLMASSLWRIAMKVGLTPLIPLSQP